MLLAKIAFARAEITCSNFNELELDRSEVSKCYVKNSKIGSIRTTESTLRKYKAVGQRLDGISTSALGVK